MACALGSILKSQVIAKYVDTDMGSMLRGEWSVAHSCGDNFCRAIMVAFEVGEGWKWDIPMVLHTTDP